MYKKLDRIREQEKVRHAEAYAKYLESDVHSDLLKSLAQKSADDDEDAEKDSDPAGWKSYQQAVSVKP